MPAAHVCNIEREAATLRRLDHPGVVHFVDLIETPDGGRALHTDFVNSDTWATRPFTDPTERAAGVAALADVVADLHGTGLAHGQIDPSHVLHGDGDQPVLCGFRLATEATVESRRDDLVALADLCHDPALEPGPLVGKLSALADEARAGRLDVRELARRLAMVADKRPAPGEPTRAGRDRVDGPRSKRSRRPSLVVVAAVLGASAAVLAAGVWTRGGQATSAPATVVHRDAPPAVRAGIEAAADDALRASMEAAADDALEDGEAAASSDVAGSPITVAADSAPVAAENTPNNTDPATAENTANSADPAATQAPSPPNPAATAAAAASEHPTATAADRGSSLPNPATTAGEDPTATRASPPPNTATTAGEDPTATAATPASMIPGMFGPGVTAGPGLAGAAAGGAMNSAAGASLLPPISSGADRPPPDGLAGHEPGTVLEHGGRLYGVGAPGDFVETGDWDCDGEPTPAIVRPSTGDVVLFDAWPAPHRSISMPVRWEVDAPTGAEAVAHGSCDLLRVYTSAGSRLFDPMADR